MAQHLPLQQFPPELQHIVEQLTVLCAAKKMRRIAELTALIDRMVQEELYRDEPPENTA